MPIAQSSTKTHVSTKNIHKKSETESEQVKPVEQQQQGSSNTGARTPPDQPEFIKQTLIIIEKKARNLDKRRQRLEEYKASERKGTVLNEDQLLAVSKYEEVLRTLELSRELEKQFIALANDTMKQQKKQAKKDQIEKEEQLKERLKETYKYFTVLEKFADDVVRNHFLEEANGAIKLSQSDLELLDAFDKLVAPGELGAKIESCSGEFADHLFNLMEGKNKPIQTLETQTTYAELKKLFERIMAAPYWTDSPKKSEPVAEVEQETSSEQVVEQEQQQVAADALSSGVEDMQLNEQQQQIENEQALYANQQSADDYVIVSSSECTESLCHSKSPSLQPQQPTHHEPNSFEQHQQLQQQDLTQSQQQQQQKTFFTTLNQPEQRNINEFINSCENNDGGINFFQDSELLARQQHEQQQQQHTDMNFQQQQQQSQPQEQFNQQRNVSDMRQDKFQHRGGQNGGQRSYQQRGDRRYPDDRRNVNSNIQQPRQEHRDNRGPRPQGSRPQGPRDGQQGNGPRGPYRGGQNGGGIRSENGPRGGNAPRNANFQQQAQQQQ